MSQQVDVVRRKLMASLHKPVIEHAVDRGFDRTSIEEVMVLCGGDQATVERMWKAFNEQPSQQDEDMFDLAEFVEFIKATLPKPKPTRAEIRDADALLGVTPRKRRRKKQQHGKGKRRSAK